ncbi:uncharacterized protein LOC130454429 [Monodelphis domestica]|uniref:uncharacterized protein LOC130454429 n=1 Tax=Monodelphis domestica TaxID=13616 RepID=UPI0024E217AF|nr:uncharacterized protein LOC130454429 [Monodelphis domestica]XP_056654151.1 uncharacterized protein LOC130454429 [Monodelphis domestica]
MGTTSEGENQIENCADQTVQAEVPLDIEGQLRALQISARRGLDHVNNTKEKISKLNQAIRLQSNEIESVKSRCLELQDSIASTKRLKEVSLKITWSKLSELESDLKKAKENTAYHLKEFQSTTNTSDKWSERLRKLQCEMSRKDDIDTTKDCDPYTEAFAMAIIRPKSPPRSRMFCVSYTTNEEAFTDYSELGLNTSDFQKIGEDKSQGESLSTSLVQLESKTDSILLRTEMDKNDVGSGIHCSSPKVKTNEDNSEEVNEISPGVLGSENPLEYPLGVNGDRNDSGFQSFKDKDSLDIEDTWALGVSCSTSVKDLSGSPLRVKNNSSPLGGSCSETKINRNLIGDTIVENEGVNPSEVKSSRTPSRVKISEGSLLGGKTSCSDSESKLSKGGFLGAKYSKNPSTPKHTWNPLVIKSGGSASEGKQSEALSGTKRHENLTDTNTGSSTRVRVGASPAKVKYRDCSSRVRDSDSSLGVKKSENAKSREGSATARVSGNPSGVRMNKHASVVKGSGNPPGAKRQFNTSGVRSSLEVRISGSDLAARYSFSSLESRTSARCYQNSASAKGSSIQKTHSK